MKQKTKILNNPEPIPKELSTATLGNSNREKLFQTDDASASLQKEEPLKSKRMSISLPPDIAELLEFLANIQGISQNEALRKAIATEGYLQQEIREGSTILIQKSNKRLKEVVFR